ncbi:hypothetical protein LZ31DRAFT_290582 [Colletotrichum somersetense]|nr:hypothetical protein LZ31DRAFT_290582 [Colletotrichum somersetense]
MIPARDFFLSFFLSVSSACCYLIEPGASIDRCMYLNALSQLIRCCVVFRLSAAPGVEAHCPISSCRLLTFAKLGV